MPTFSYQLATCPPRWVLCNMVTRSKDMTPKSSGGRFFVSIAALLGVSMKILFISILLRFFDRRPSEIQIQDFLAKAKIKPRRLDEACRLIQATWAYYAAYMRTLPWIQHPVTGVYYREISQVNNTWTLPTLGHAYDVLSWYRILYHPLQSVLIFSIRHACFLSICISFKPCI